MDNHHRNTSNVRVGNSILCAYCGTEMQREDWIVEDERMVVLYCTCSWSVVEERVIKLTEFLNNRKSEIAPLLNTVKERIICRRVMKTSSVNETTITEVVNLINSFLLSEKAKIDLVSPDPFDEWTSF